MGPLGTNGGRAGTNGWRGDLPFLGIAAVVALGVVLVNTFNVVDERASLGRPIDVWEPAVWEGTSAVVILALLPAVLWLVRRAPPRRPPPFGWIFAHLGGLLVFSLAHVSAMGALRSLVYAAAGDRYDALYPLRDWPYELRQDAFTYFAFVALYVAWRMLRDRRAPAAAPAGEAVLEVRDGARRHFVSLADVAWIEAAGNYVELHRGGAPILHRTPLSEMERQLADAGFVRIHRSRLVRRGAVAQVESKPTGDFVVRLHDGRELAGSRRYRRPLLEP